MNYICLYPNCNKPIETPTPWGKYCIEHKKIAQKENVKKARERQRKGESNSRDEKAQEIECLHRKNILCEPTERKCKKCGFYPPVEEERKRKIRERMER